MNTTTTAPTSTKTPAFETALAAFLAQSQEIITSHYKRSFPNQTIPTLKVDPRGRKYVRIWCGREDGYDNSAHCFVEIATGNVFKPDGYKKPAPGIRGNIYKLAETPAAKFMGSSGALTWVR